LSIPPAHRWVRTASTTRSNRGVTNNDNTPSSQQQQQQQQQQPRGGTSTTITIASAAAAMTTSSTAASAAVPASADDAIARSIREIIRQRSKEERASEARARVAKRKISVAPAGAGAVGTTVAAAAGLNGAAKALRASALRGSGSGSGSGGGAESTDLALLPPGSTGSVGGGAMVGAGGAGESQFGRGGGSSGITMTPQVQVINGHIVINEKSLTVNAAVERATALSDFTRVEVGLAALSVKPCRVFSQVLDPRFLICVASLTYRAITYNIEH